MPLSPRFALHMRGGRRLLVVLVSLALTLVAEGSTRAASSEVSIAPVAAGDLGAWLAIGPIALQADKGKSPAAKLDTQLLRGVEENLLAARFGKVQPLLPTVVAASSSLDESEARTWRLVATEGSIDLSSALGRPERESFAYLFGVLHLTQPLHGALLIGVSDGIRVWVDRRLRLSNDSVRYARDDEETIPLDLAPGDHPILLKLHRRHSAWALRVRLVDNSLVAPQGALFRLPGTSAREIRTAAERLLSVRVDRGLEQDSYRPSVGLHFAAGVPEGADRSVVVQTSIETGVASRVLFRSSAGQLPPPSAGMGTHRVGLPPIEGEDLAEVERGGKLIVRVAVAGKSIDARLSPRPWMRQALLDAERVIERCDPNQSPFLSDPETLRSTVEHLTSRIKKDVGAGDSDLEPAQADARQIHDYLGDLDERRDPLQVHGGVQRLAYRSPLDGGLSPFGLYVPPTYVANTRAAPSLGSTTASSSGGAVATVATGHQQMGASRAEDGSAPYRSPESGKAAKQYPLIVALHGMNGKPLAMLGHFFGKDDPNRDAEWEDRHPGPAPAIDAFVLAPNAFGNAMYRELGEVDVIDRLDWAMRTYPIDPNRVTITGLSMGGTGTAYLAFHHPHRFAAAEPLCGYHSYFIRGDIAGKPLRPWERLLCEQRSTVMWAENGINLPIFVWHGKRDYPEKNSGVLIQRYKQLGYSVEDEHPNVGHDVWRIAYDDLRGYKWLTEHERVAHPKHVIFKTDSLRYADDAWVHIRALERQLEFGQVDATIRDAETVEVTTQGVTAFSLDRDPELLSSTASVQVRVDGTDLTYDASAAIEAVRTSGGWAKGAPASSSTQKRAGLSGPIRDIFYEPLVFVYGTQDPQQVRANLDIARAWARIRWGVDARYPILPDVDLDDETSASHSLVLVGNAASNRVVRELESALPFRVLGDKIVAYPRSAPKARERAPVEWRGSSHLGVAFIHPNPKHPNRYVLVIEGTSPLGTLRSLALPDLLPDYIVYDERIAPARGQIVLGNARPLAAGMFEQDWSLRTP